MDAETGSGKKLICLLTIKGLGAIIFFASVFLITAGFTGCSHNIQPDMPSRNNPQTGMASWYGWEYHGRVCASGEIYDMYKLTAAHKSLPFGIRVRVTNLENGRNVVVRINDRGPFIRNRIIDLSYAAAKKIGMIRHGTAKVRIEIAD